MFRTLPLSALFLAPFSLFAASSIHVDSKAEGAKDGTSWDDAFTTLQAALAVAGSGDEIRIARGTYFPDEGPGQSDGDPSSVFEIPDGVTVVGGYESGGSVSPNPLLRPVVLSGDLDQDDDDPDGDGIITSAADINGQNAHHVVRIADGAKVFLYGGTVTAGHAGGGGSDDNGGGVLVGGTGELTMERCVVTGCRSDGSGGGVWASKGALEFVNSRFSGNHADVFGGGMAIDVGDANLVNVVVLGNTASTGGGIAVDDQPLTLTNVTFSGNAANSGGGAIFADNGAVLTLENTIAWNNMEDGDVGDPPSSLTLAGGSSASFSSCLLQGYDLGGLPQGFDGTSASNAPDFHQPANPAAAPTSDGDLRLLPESVGIDKGVNGLNGEPTDLAAEPRIVGLIDLGAYEFQQVLYVDDTASGLGHGGSWENAFTNLQAALAAVQSGWTIRVARGDYYPDEGPGQTNNNNSSTFELINNVALLGGYPNGGGTRNPASHPTLLSGDLQQDDDDPDGDGLTNAFSELNGINAIHVVTAQGVGSSAVLDGFIINAGRATLASGSNDRGAGMWIDAASPTIRSCRFIGNFARQYGGGVYQSGAASQPTYEDCRFFGNGVDGASAATRGGAVSVVAGAGGTFQRCEFRGNSSEDHGGALGLDGGTVTLENCLFSGNRAGVYGGAVFAFQPTGTDITGCTFSANAAGDPGGGGAVYNVDTHIDFTNTVMWNNRAGGSTTNQSSSYTTNFNIGASPTQTYDHCLIQGRNLSGIGVGNFNGVLTANDPLFHINATPAGDAHLDGDFHLSTGSPIANQGNNAAAGASDDLDGESRIQGGTIDLGAYEGTSTDPDLDNDGLPNNWEFLHTSPNSFTSLDPASDDDHDGLTALSEFAHGTDPNVPNGSGSVVWWTEVESGGTAYPGLTYKRGPGVADFVRFIVEHSYDLGVSDAWDDAPVMLHDQNGSLWVHRGSAAISGPARQFLRVRVEKREP